MKKILILYIIGAIIVFTMWIYAYHASNRPKNATTNEYLFYGKENNDVERLNTVYVALGALFTALAFGGALCSILYQHWTTLRATSLEVFTKTFNSMLTDAKFNKTLQYILHHAHEQKTIEELKQEKIKSKDNYEIEAYKTLFYFCDKMEYIGILIKQKYISNALLFPYGKKISDAFNILNKWSFFEGNNKKRFIHFRYLVYLINTNENKYDKYCSRIGNKARRNEEKKQKLSFTQRISSRIFRQTCKNICRNYEEKNY